MLHARLQSDHRVTHLLAALATALLLLSLLTLLPRWEQSLRVVAAGEPVTGGEPGQEVPSAADRAHFPPLTLSLRARPGEAQP